MWNPHTSKRQTLLVHIRHLPKYWRRKTHPLFPSIDYNKPARPGLPGAAGQRIKDLMVPFHPSACRPAARAQPAVMCPPGFAPPACTLPGTPGTDVAQWKLCEQAQGKVLLFCLSCRGTSLHQCHHPPPQATKEVPYHQLRPLHDTSSRCHQELSLPQWWQQDRTFCCMVTKQHTAILHLQQCTKRDWTLSPLCLWKPAPIKWMVLGAFRLLKTFAWSTSTAHIPA